MLTFCQKIQAARDCSCIDSLAVLLSAAGSKRNPDGSIFIGDLHAMHGISVGNRKSGPYSAPTRAPAQPGEPDNSCNRELSAATRRCSACSAIAKPPYPTPTTPTPTRAIAVEKGRCRIRAMSQNVIDPFALCSDSSQRSPIPPPIARRG